MDINNFDQIKDEVKAHMTAEAKGKMAELVDDFYDGSKKAKEKPGTKPEEAAVEDCGCGGVGKDEMDNKDEE